MKNTWVICGFLICFGLTAAVVWLNDPVVSFVPDESDQQLSNDRMDIGKALKRVEDQAIPITSLLKPAQTKGAEVRKPRARADFESLVIGDSISLSILSRLSVERDYQILLTDIESHQGALVMRGRTNSGDAFRATIGPNMVNVLLETTDDLYRFSGTDFKGSLKPMEILNLKEDIRRRPIASAEESLALEAKKRQ